MISGYSAAFMIARLLFARWQRTEAVLLFAVREISTSPPGIFLISSENSLPGSTVCPSSTTSATFVYSMERDPSEQVRLILLSSATISTPSRICLAGLADNALVTVLRPSSRS